MTKIIHATINIGDVQAAEEILKALQAPVTKDNITNLKVIITELGELYEDAYNTMLLKSVNQRLATYNVNCTCGQPISIVVDRSSEVAPTISSCGKH